MCGIKLKSITSLTLVTGVVWQLLKETKRKKENWPKLKMFGCCQMNQIVGGS